VSTPRTPVFCACSFATETTLPTCNHSGVNVLRPIQHMHRTGRPSTMLAIVAAAGAWAAQMDTMSETLSWHQRAERLRRVAPLRPKARVLQLLLRSRPSAMRQSGRRGRWQPRWQRC